MRTVTVDPAELRPALKLIIGALGDVNKAPVFHRYVLLESTEAALRLTLHGFHCSASTEVSALCSDEFIKVGIEVKQFRSLIDATDETVTITQHEGGVGVATATSTHHFNMLDADRFPLPQISTEHKAAVSGSLLTKMLATVLPAAETNRFGELRWQALEWSAKDSKLAITGCCGPFLISTETPLNADFYALTPVRHAELIQALAKRSEAVNIAVSGGLLTVSSSAGSVNLQLLAAPWPDWRMLLMEQYEHAVEVDAPVAVAALKRAMLFCRLYDDKIDPRVTFALTADRATLMCQGRGESREQIAIKGNGDVKLALDGARLSAFLRLVDGAVVWQFSTGSALRLTPKEQGEFTVQGLLMPLHDVSL